MAMQMAIYVLWNGLKCIEMGPEMLEMYTEMLHLRIICILFCEIM